MSVDTVSRSHSLVLASSYRGFPSVGNSIVQLIIPAILLLTTQFKSVEAGAPPNNNSPVPTDAFICIGQCTPITDLNPISIARYSACVACCTVPCTKIAMGAITWIASYFGFSSPKPPPPSGPGF